MSTAVTLVQKYEITLKKVDDLMSHSQKIILTKLAYTI
jgi:hypothetical protein